MNPASNTGRRGFLTGTATVASTESMAADRGTPADAQRTAT